MRDLGRQPPVDIPESELQWSSLAGLEGVEPRQASFECCDLSDDEDYMALRRKCALPDALWETPSSPFAFDTVDKRPSLITDGTTKSAEAPAVELVLDGAAPPASSSELCPSECDDGRTLNQPHRDQCQCPSCLHAKFVRATTIVKQFSHNPYAAVLPPPPPLPKRMCCYFKQHGWCKKGDDCWYGHVGDLYTPCHYGSSCKAGHATLTVMAGYDPLEELKAAPALSKRGESLGDADALPRHCPPKKPRCIMCRRAIDPAVAGSSFCGDCLYFRQQ